MMQSVNHSEKQVSPKEQEQASRFQCLKTVEFERAFRKLDKPAQKQVDQIIQEVLFTEPYESKKLVSPELKGKRSLRKGDYRVIFSICEECKKLHEDRINNCFGCNRYETNNVMIFLCGHRNHIYDA
jgi:mRNA-degrading endonuclease RelE of RelBE toxin-antitoxin system